MLKDRIANKTNLQKLHTILAAHHGGEISSIEAVAALGRICGVSPKDRSGRYMSETRRHDDCPRCKANEVCLTHTHIPGAEMSEGQEPRCQWCSKPESRNHGKWKMCNMAKPSAPCDDIPFGIGLGNNFP